MIAIPQCLDFADARLTKDICEFYLRMLEIKNREIYLHSQQVANYSASTAAKLGLPASEVSQIKQQRCCMISVSFPYPILFWLSCRFFLRASSLFINVTASQAPACWKTFPALIPSAISSARTMKMGRHRLSQTPEGTEHPYRCTHSRRSQLL